MAGWESLGEIVREELTQSKEEGKDAARVDAIAKRIDAAGDDQQALAALHEELLQLPVGDDFPYHEPSDLDAIRAARAGAASPVPWSLDDYALYDRLYGAWLGRCAGCALGKPVETGPFMTIGVPAGGPSSKDRIKRYLTAISPDEYPIRGYFPEHSPAEDEVGHLHAQASTREHIAFMQSDDDIRYTVLGQVVLDYFGHDFTSEDVMAAWLRHLPYRFVCTAETQVYRNYVWRYAVRSKTSPKQPVDWHWLVTHQNPYREWIGAQIRADHWGYAAPGDPQRAAEMAWRDARISHVKNGIYGAMCVAAMIAAAFTADDPRMIVEAGLAQIPATSRLHEALTWTVACCERHGRSFDRFETVLEEIYQRLGHYHPVHTINNAALVVAALMLGEGDLEKTIGLAVMGGWDTDCNGATAGSILGAQVGANRLPAKWIAPLHETLNSEIIGYHPIAISACARRSVRLARTGTTAAAPR